MERIKGSTSVVAMPAIFQPVPIRGLETLISTMHTANATENEIAA